MIIMELSIKSTRIKGALTQYTYENVLVCTPDIPLPRPWHLFIRVVTLGLNKTFRAVQFKDKTYSGHKTMLCKRKMHQNVIWISICFDPCDSIYKSNAYF